VELTEAQSAGAEAEAPQPSGLDVIRALPRDRQIAVAVVGAVLGVACFVRFGVTGRAAVGAGFSAVLVLLTAIDLDSRRLPNIIVLPALALALVAQIALFPDRTVEWVLSSLLAALFLFLPLLIVPTGMGMGDVKLAALLGAVLGKSVAEAVLFGLVAGALFSIGILVREGMSARKKAIAYGPFLAFGALIVLFLGGR
jgi:leader peptidase (prepilin peptidase)/N-methyltransferase